MKSTYGTGCFLLLNPGARAVASRSGLVTTIACDATGGLAYALVGSVFMVFGGSQLTPPLVERWKTMLAWASKVV